MRVLGGVLLDGEIGDLLERHLGIGESIVAALIPAAAKNLRARVESPRRVGDDGPKEALG